MPGRTKNTPLPPSILNSPRVKHLLSLSSDSSSFPPSILASMESESDVSKTSAQVRSFVERPGREREGGRTPTPPFLLPTERVVVVSSWSSRPSGSNPFPSSSPLYTSVLPGVFVLRSSVTSWKDCEDIEKEIRSRFTTEDWEDVSTTFHLKPTFPESVPLHVLQNLRGKEMVRGTLLGIGCWNGLKGVESTSWFSKLPPCVRNGLVSVSSR